ncbi:MAG: hypothetical protein EP297_08625 [Gammaproteobacteria bacterium]|nr:MAG: hypothetical protein EP297_08625 [Gammaproteobacteria bacterium]
MSRNRLNNLLKKGDLARIRDRAAWLSRLNECLERQLPLSINTTVQLADIDSRNRAVLHLQGGEWASQVRLHQKMIMAILRSCGVEDIRGVVVRNRPFDLMRKENRRSKFAGRTISPGSRDLINSCATSIENEDLKDSLQRLARHSR